MSARTISFLRWAPSLSRMKLISTIISSDAKPLAGITVSAAGELADVLVPDVEEIRKVLHAGDMDLRLEAIGEARPSRFQDALDALARPIPPGAGSAASIPIADAVPAADRCRARPSRRVRSPPRTRNRSPPRRAHSPRTRDTRAPRRIDRLELPLRVGHHRDQRRRHGALCCRSSAR